MSLTDSFESRSSDELGIAKDDRIELIELDGEFGDGWFLGKNIKSGTIGLFPGGKLLSSPLTASYYIRLSLLAAIVPFHNL